MNFLLPLEGGCIWWAISPYGMLLFDGAMAGCALSNIRMLHGRVSSRGDRVISPIDCACENIIFPIIRHPGLPPRAPPIKFYYREDARSWEIPPAPAQPPGYPCGGSAAHISRIYTD